jgi:cytidylate kinase
VERLLMPGPPLSAEMAVGGGAEPLTLELLDTERCLNLVSAAIHAEYKAGRAVIVGRGGQAVLQRVPGALHVLIQAPMPARILRIQEGEKVGMEEAYHRATQHDRKTSRYLERVFNIKWDDPLLYHLIINTGKWDLEQASQIIVHAAKVVEA